MKGSAKGKKTKSCSKPHTTKPTSCTRELAILYLFLRAKLMNCIGTPATATTASTTETTAPSGPSFTGSAGALAVPGMAGSVVLGVVLGVF